MVLYRFTSTGSTKPAKKLQLIRDERLECMELAYLLLRMPRAGNSSWRKLKLQVCPTTPCRYTSHFAAVFQEVAHSAMLREIPHRGSL